MMLMDKEILHVAIYLLVGFGVPALVYRKRKSLTSGPRLFAALFAIGAAFSMLNLGPLGVILGAPAYTMAAAFGAYIVQRRT